ncbi:unnamed protein product [Phytophthora lilii]|uniref:Unnamed protein product n=1 Tax=Phytophthora lilii TaxID=2077276 RepID=A0A9W6WEN3_9STRA|nr:unnamed protein product [Phytophthora lilii]
MIGRDWLDKLALKSDPEIKVSSGKRVPFVIDLNQGSYQNGVITIDATAQLNGSEGFACLRDAYIMLPYRVSMKNGATPQTAAANRFCSTLKCGNWNAIDSIPQYVEKHGAESFLFLDAAQSALFSSATSLTTGDGYTNTTAFSSSFATTGPAGGASIPNDGLVKHLLSNPPNAGSDFSASWPSVGGAVASTTISIRPLVVPL